MEYMTSKEASERWGIPQRKIAELCREGKVVYVETITYKAEQDKPGTPWRIPIQIKCPISK